MNSETYIVYTEREPTRLMKITVKTPVWGFNTTVAPGWHRGQQCLVCERRGGIRSKRRLLLFNNGGLIN